MNPVQRVTDLVRVMVQAQARVTELEEALSKAKEDYRRVECVDLPELMRELGLTELKLEDGTAVSVRHEVNCAITEAHSNAAHAWLRANGFGGLIKTEVVATFGRGEEDAANAAIEALALGGVEPAVVERVHPQTLKSFVREQLEAGANLPVDLFSLRPFDRAKVTAPKSKKG